jgi:orotidine-5'-phosphate decarboxylase
MTRLIYGDSVRKTVIQFAHNAGSGGAYGVVCSPQELRSLGEYPELWSLIKVTPAIRPVWYQSDDDQKRTMTPREAVKCGADFLVIGRPILQFSDPFAAVEKIKEEMQFRSP